MMRSGYESFCHIAIWLEHASTMISRLIYIYWLYCCDFATIRYRRDDVPWRNALWSPPAFDYYRDFYFSMD